MTDRFEEWMAALEARQLADLTFSEVSRALRALSSTYVERRSKLSEGAALSGAGKRAAFALFYGPLHFLLVRQIVAALGKPFTTIESLLDLGCGTGASSAGWAAACVRAPRITAVDRHPWAVEEARRTYGDLGLHATARVDDLTQVSMSGGRRMPHGGRRAKGGKVPGIRDQGSGTAERGRAVLLAFAVNEIAQAEERDALLARLIEHGHGGGRVLVVEPLAGFVAPWWKDWQRAFESAGGRADEWRFRVPLPAIVEKLDRAAGLNHRELRARALAL